LVNEFDISVKEPELVSRILGTFSYVNSRPICTSDSRIDMYHQKEYGGG